MVYALTFLIIIIFISFILSSLSLSSIVLFLQSFYHPPRSCGKVMFLHLSVILSTGGVSGRHPPGRHPLADTPLGRHPQGRHPLGNRHPPGQTPHPGQTLPRQAPPQSGTPPPRDGHCSGPYASYRNAFLFFLLFLAVFLTFLTVSFLFATFLQLVFSIFFHCFLKLLQTDLTSCGKILLLQRYIQTWINLKNQKCLSWCPRL